MTDSDSMRASVVRKQGSQVNISAKMESGSGLKRRNRHQQIDGRRGFNVALQRFQFRFVRRWCVTFIKRPIAERLPIPNGICMALAGRWSGLCVGFGLPQLDAIVDGRFCKVNTSLPEFEHFDTLVH
jgi:hypothetical protein